MNMLRLILGLLCLMPCLLQAECRLASANGLGFASDSYSPNMALPPLIELKDSSLQPEGSLLAASIINLATLNNISPEQVLYICELSDADYLQQAYVINSTNHSGGTELSLYPGYYPTWFENVAIRLTNMVTGEFFAGWKTSAIQGETFIDTDGVERLAIKAKHFDNVKIELIKINSQTQQILPQATYLDPQPMGYITLKAPGLASNDIVAGSYNRPGWPMEWAGAYSLYNNLTLKRLQSCTVTNVTPVVFFPPVSLSSLLDGGQLRANINIEIKCSNGGSEAVMGIQVPSNSYNYAKKINGLTTSEGGVYYLLSDGYGEQNDVATGVGIRFERNSDGQRVILISQHNQQAEANSERGYYPVLQGVRQINSSGIYHYDFSAILERLPGEQIKPGRIYAKAYVVVQVP